MLIVASVNVNGIRAAHRRGMPQWLAERNPDLLCLQEVRATDAVLRDLVGEGWHIAHSEPTLAGTKGRSGVAVLSRIPFVETRDHLSECSVGQGRWIETDVRIPQRGHEPAADDPIVTVISVYVHSGEADTPKQDAKYAFLKAMSARLADLAADGRPVLVCGDINIAHQEDDLKNWKANQKRAGFLPEERAYLDTWFTDGAWVDVHRMLHGPGPGPYSWWSWRGKAFDNDAGWRIDYHLATAPFAAAAKTAEVDRAPSYDTRWSDHAPVVVAYNRGLLRNAD